ncbi:MAG: biotin--[acetyl-CoA-carboxylase] ligase [Desulfuromonadaceae bacterium]|nr:biotin--[acetyl-CoA-carboxylase] ligase [Desulfuromonadaceae bacterium]
MDGRDDLSQLAGVGFAESRRIGCSVVYLESTDSTNLQARRLAEQGAPEGTVVIADEQSGGRGRMGRNWVSPPGVNLYLSVVLRPRLAPQQAPQITLLSSLAVAEAVECCCGLIAGVKWPNDVLLGGKKVAGLLGEIAATMSGVDFIILGIGLNVNMRIDQLPERPLYPASSVAIEKGETVPRVPLAKRLLRLLDLHYGIFLEEGFDPIRRRWQERCAMLGRRVEIDGGGGLLSGEAFGIDGEGALLLRLQGGRVERVLSGDILAVH